MKKIFVCSPYRSDNSKNGITGNIILANRICRNITFMGRTPFAPHLFFTRFLDDKVDAEREIGIQCGLEFLKNCDELWFYSGNGISRGMQKEIAQAIRFGIPVMRIVDVETMETMSYEVQGA